MKLDICFDLESFCTMKACVVGAFQWQKCPMDVFGERFGVCESTFILYN